jgi:hypothetical protein
MKTQKTLKLIEANKEIQKNLKKLNYYSAEQFISDCQAYIKAIEDRRMICIIKSVSSTGMSRVIKFSAPQKSKDGKFYYRNFNCLFITLGYSEAKNKDGFRINGCGMDMVFHTNYCIIHDMFRLGLINEEQKRHLAQETPVVL